jgi:hypothetical protein
VAALTGGTTLALGAIATWLLSRQDLALGLREAGLSTSLGLSHRRALSMIVALQVAAATSLGLVSGLLIRSMTNIVNVDLGFDPGQSFFVRFFLPEEQYPTSEQQLAYFERALERVRSLPEVVSAGIAQSPPLSRAVVTLGGELTLEVPGRSVENLAPLVGQYVTPGYFESLGIRMIRGRAFPRKTTAAKCRWSSSRMRSVAHALARAIHCRQAFEWRARFTGSSAPRATYARTGQHQERARRCTSSGDQDSGPPSDTWW